MLGEKIRIPYKVNSGKYKINSIKNIYDLHSDNENLKVWTKSKWKNAKITRKKIDLLYEVTFNNDNNIYYFDKNHLFKILGEDNLQETYMLMTGDEIPYARKPFRDRDLFEYRTVKDVTDEVAENQYVYDIEVNSSMYMLYSGLYIWNPKLYKENF